MIPGTEVNDITSYLSQEGIYIKCMMKFSKIPPQPSPEGRESPPSPSGRGRGGMQQHDGNFSVRLALQRHLSFKGVN